MRGELKERGNAALICTQSLRSLHLSLQVLVKYLRDLHTQCEPSTWMTLERGTRMTRMTIAYNFLLEFGRPPVAWQNDTNHHFSSTESCNEYSNRSPYLGIHCSAQWIKKVRKRGFARIGSTIKSIVCSLGSRFSLWDHFLFAVYLLPLRRTKLNKRAITTSSERDGDVCFLYVTFLVITSPW